MTQSSSWQPHEKLMKAFEALVVGETIHVFNARDRIEIWSL